MKKVDEVYEKIIRNKDNLDKSSDVISHYSTSEKCKTFQATESKNVPPFRAQQTFGSSTNISQDLNSSRMSK